MAETQKGGQLNKPDGYRTKSVDSISKAKTDNNYQYVSYIQCSESLLSVGKGGFQGAPACALLTELTPNHGRRSGAFGPQSVACDGLHLVSGVIHGLIPAVAKLLIVRCINEHHNPFPNPFSF